MVAPASRRMLRGSSRVSYAELFFDLVYVFAITQLSHLLAAHPDGTGAWQTAVLLAMVWQLWVYTTWDVNYLDPDRGSVRAMLLVVMLGSLIVAAALGEAFGSRGMLVAWTYAVLHLAQPLFMVWALRGEELQLAFVRIVPWNVLTGAIVVLGAFEHGALRGGLWALSVAIDLGGAAIGFWVPRLGGSATNEWTISGSHFAERCQAFVLIALGESIVVMGTNLAARQHPGVAELAAFGLAFTGTAAMWWVYFDRAAEDSAEVIAESDDPGRLARNAFHWVHPVIVAGIIVVASADELVLAHPTAHGRMSTAWLVFVGTALYLGGHALFKAVVWRTVSWPRVIGAAVSLALLVLAPHVSVLTIGALALVIIAAVAVSDRVMYPHAAAAPGEPA